ncbi:MAG: hypothetical protein LBC39_02580 [Methanobrevibacter sp.]|nr:hypothetical protein [Candidatus Methanovirga aequatorialis]
MLDLQSTVENIDFSSLESLDVDTSSITNASEDVTTLGDEIRNIPDDTVVNVDTSSIDNAAADVEELNSGINNIETFIQINIDVSDLENAKNAMEEVKSAEEDITSMDLSSQFGDLAGAIGDAAVAGVGLGSSLSAIQLGIASADSSQIFYNIADAAGYSKESMDGMLSSMSSINTQGVKVRGVATVWADFGRTVGLSESSIVQMGDSMLKVAANASNLGKDGVGAVNSLTGAMLRWSNGTQLQGRMLANLAKTTGLTKDQISELQAVALEYGEDSQEFVDATNRMTGSMDTDKPLTFAQTFQQMKNEIAGAARTILTDVKPTFDWIVKEAKVVYGALEGLTGGNTAELVVGGVMAGGLIVGLKKLISFFTSLKNIFGKVSDAAGKVKTDTVSKSITSLKDSLKNMGKIFVQAAVAMAIAAALIAEGMLLVAGIGVVFKAVEPQFNQGTEGIKAVAKLLTEIAIPLAALILAGIVFNKLGLSFIGALSGVAEVMTLISETLLFFVVPMLAIAANGALYTSIQGQVQDGIEGIKIVSQLLTDLAVPLGLIIVAGALLGSIGLETLPEMILGIAAVFTLISETLLGFTLPLLALAAVGAVYEEIKDQVNDGITAVQLSITSIGLTIQLLILTLQQIIETIINTAVSVITTFISGITTVIQGISDGVNTISSMTINSTGLWGVAASITLAGIGYAAIGFALAGFAAGLVGAGLGAMVAKGVSWILSVLGGNPQNVIQGIQNNINNMKSVDSGKLDGIKDSINTARDKFKDLTRALDDLNSAISDWNNKTITTPENKTIKAPSVTREALPAVPRFIEPTIPTSTQDYVNDLISPIAPLTATSKNKSVVGGNNVVKRRIEIDTTSDVRLTAEDNVQINQENLDDLEKKLLAQQKDYLNSRKFRDLLNKQLATF